LEPNPRVDEAAMAGAARIGDRREAVQAYFEMQRTLCLAAPINVGGFLEDARPALDLATPPGQADALAGIDHQPGSLVARVTHAALVRRLISWRDTRGGAREVPRRLAMLRDCLLASAGQRPRGDRRKRDVPGAKH
jgi:hypothetical protein